MSPFSSISNALERIHLPKNTKLDFNHGIGYLDPIIQGRHISVTTIATVAAILATSYHVLFNVFEVNKPKGYRDIPKLSTWRMLYNTIFKEMHITKRYRKLMRKTMEEHGIVRVDLLGRSTVYLGTPEYARQVLLHTQTFQKILPTEQFPKSFFSRFFGNNLVGSNGSEWKHHRKVCNPAFHKSWPTNISGDCTNKMLQLIASETKSGVKSIDMSNMTKRLALDVLGNAAFGFNFNAVMDPNGEHVTLYQHIMSQAFKPLYILLPWLDGIPFIRRTKLLKAGDDFNRLLSKVIEEKRQKLHNANEQGVALDNKDLLALMIEANESDEDALTNNELRSDVLIFFLAGHDTTANALASLIYNIAIRPDLQEKLYAEIFDIVGPATTSNSTPIPTLEQIKDMKLLDAAMKESMRMYPSVPLVTARQVFSNISVGPYTIPPGVEIMINTYSIHHNPKYWDNPDEFRPERFLPDADGNLEKRDPAVWIPFSYGSRSCIGMNFALTEQRVVLSMLLHRFKFALPADSPHKDSLQFAPRGITAVDKLRIEFTPRY